jgi:UDP-glucose 4-epimerase
MRLGQRAFLAARLRQKTSLAGNIPEGIAPTAIYIYTSSAQKYLEKQDFLKVNLGTGQGTSVLELVRAFSKACGREIPTVRAPRRDGDVASYYASPELAATLLGWRATRDISDMCNDAWRWQSRNPDGYRSEQ